ncbi:uncharacterized protein FOBCDRAFT_125500, partial [Fusarium oxysporum Fo47]|uniref:uncharacterized protein n=1 Tax=Fusarium oxysporum Fo47 TaxID=660027 RepID=UPI002869BE0A
SSPIPIASKRRMPLRVASFSILYLDFFFAISNNRFTSRLSNSSNIGPIKTGTAFPKLLLLLLLLLLSLSLNILLLINKSLGNARL